MRNALNPTNAITVESLRSYESGHSLRHTDAHGNVIVNRVCHSQPEDPTIVLVETVSINGSVLRPATFATWCDLDLDTIPVEYV